jgi:hypothetical protein
MWNHAVAGHVFNAKAQRPKGAKTARGTEKTKDFTSLCSPIRPFTFSFASPRLCAFALTSDRMIGATLLS